MVELNPVAATAFDNLVEESLVADGIVIEPQPTCAKLIVRGSGSTEFQDAVANVLGMIPPKTPNTVARQGDLESGDALFWLGPDEWLYRCNDSAGESVDSILVQIRNALRDQHSAVVDVSDYYAVIRLSGPKVFELLAKGTPLDCVAALSAANLCAQTSSGHASVLLDRIDDDNGVPCVNLQVRWSFVEAVWAQMKLAMLEYQ